MNETVASIAAPPEAEREAPWHFWPVVGIAVLWNGYGALDYTMTKLGDASWLAGVDPAFLAKVAAAPLWATAAWALGVWCSFLGAILLGMRSRLAPAAFAVSLVTAAISFAWQFQVDIVPTPVLPVVILAMIVFFWWYAALVRRGGFLH